MPAIKTTSTSTHRFFIFRQVSFIEFHLDVAIAFAKCKSKWNKHKVLANCNMKSGFIKSVLQAGRDKEQNFDFKN